MTTYMMFSPRPLAIMLHFFHQFIAGFFRKYRKPKNIWTRLYIKHDITIKRIIFCVFLLRNGISKVQNIQYLSHLDVFLRSLPNITDSTVTNNTSLGFGFFLKQFLRLLFSFIYLFCLHFNICAIKTCLRDTVGQAAIVMLLTPQGMYTWSGIHSVLTLVGTALVDLPFETSF